MAKKKATKKKTTKKKAAAAPREPLIVASKAKAFLREHEVNCAGDALDGLNDVVYWYLEQAVKRTQDNKRKTVQKHDFITG